MVCGSEVRLFLMVLDRRENTKRKLEVLSGYAGNLYIHVHVHENLAYMASPKATNVHDMIRKRRFLRHFYYGTCEHCACTCTCTCMCWCLA